MQSSRAVAIAVLMMLGMAATLPLHARAQAPFKVGIILPMTGPFASTGKQTLAGARLYLQQHGTDAGGRRIELVVKDDASTPDLTKRLAQELIINDKVEALGGFGLTPLALAAAPVATQTKTPMVLMSASSAGTTRASPYMVRATYTVGTGTEQLGAWLAKQGLQRAVTMVSDYAPGTDAAQGFTKGFVANGGQIMENLRVPLENPDFAPYLQRARDANPQALFVFVPAGVGVAVMRQFNERGLAQAGISLVGEGGVTDDDILPAMGSAALGIMTSQHYSVAHDSPENHQFVTGFEAANNGMRPNFMAIGGYDGMHLIATALAETKGVGGDAMVHAMSHMSWISPRGPVSVDPTTRELTQNFYIRRVEMVDGQLYNVEIATIPQVTATDPSK